MKVDSDGCLRGESTRIITLSMKISLKLGYLSDLSKFSNVHINKSVDSNAINNFLNYYLLKRLLFLYVSHTHILCFYLKICDRGISGCKFFVEEPLWGMACGL